MRIFVVNWNVKDGGVLWTGMSCAVNPRKSIKLLLLFLFGASKGLVSEEMNLQLDPRFTTLKMKKEHFMLLGLDLIVITLFLIIY